MPLIPLSTFERQPRLSVVGRRPTKLMNSLIPLITFQILKGLALAGGLRLEAMITFKRQFSASGQFCRRPKTDDR
jgi:hypothetical protein